MMSMENTQVSTKGTEINMKKINRSNNKKAGGTRCRKIYLFWT
jgi:hypothetical protein